MLHQQQQQTQIQPQQKEIINILLNRTNGSLLYNPVTNDSEASENSNTKSTSIPLLYDCEALKDSNARINATNCHSSNTANTGEDAGDVDGIKIPHNAKPASMHNNDKTWL